MVAALLVLFLEAQAPQLMWKVDTKSPSYGSGSVADIDGDGKLEIVLGTYYGDEHIYALNAEDGSVLWKLKSDGGPFDASIAIVDLDGDSKPEILTGDSSTGKFFCIGGDGKEKWSFKLPNSTDSPPAVGDLNGDGTLEIVVGSMAKANGNGDVTVYDNKTREIVWQKEVEGHVQSAPCLVDLDGDEILDVIVTTWRGSNAVHAFSGKDGKRLWEFETMGEGDTDKDHFGMYHGVSASQLEKDGELRIAFATCSTVSGTLYVVNAKGELVWKKIIGEYLFAPTTMIDVDGDGAKEVIVSSERNTYVFTANGDQLWKAEYGSQRGPAVADIDGDGDLDLVMGARGSKIVALDGPTGKTVWIYDAKIAGHVYEGFGNGPLIADFDGDGTLDLFIVGGKGTVDPDECGSYSPSKDNYGRAIALRLGKGTGTCTTFRGNLRRTGTRE